MKKVLIAYFSLSGKTEQMAEYMAEGVRFSGQQVVTKKISDIKSASELAGYNGYILGSPTYYLNIAEPMQTFLFMGRKANLGGKLGGSFGSYTHNGNAPMMIFDTLQHVYKMEAFALGPLRLKEDFIETVEGMRACQDYGKTFGEKLKK